MAELEANWAGMVQARSHWYIARCRELGLAMIPTLLPPLEPWWAATDWGGVQGSQQPTGPRRVSPHHCCKSTWSCGDGNLLRRIADSVSDVATSGSLGVWMWACLPALCVCFSCTQSGKHHILSIVNWESCTTSTVGIETKSVNCTWLNTPELCWPLAYIAQLHAVSDMGTQPLTGQTGDSLMSGSSVLICWYASLINSLDSAVKGISTQIPSETLYKAEHSNPSRKKTNWK